MMMHVVSKSDHQIKLADWGFIDPDGRFSSIPMDWHADPSMGDDIVSTGSSTLAARGEYFETEYTRRDPAIGAFARSVTQGRPRLYFGVNAPLWRRARIRIRLVFQPHYLAW